MGQELICKWLGLPSGSWPPNHYVLLGLEPGESDVVRIEEHVHDRLVKLRQYQLNQPDCCTEAMNRLAQAFMCLTDPEAKKAYDASFTSPQHEEQEAAPATSTDPDPLAWLFGPATPVASSEPFPVPASLGPKTVEPAATEVDWNKSPPPPRALAALPIAASAGVAPAKPAPPPVAEPADPILESARSSKWARRGLGTKRALYQRIACTRQLLHVWEQAGKYLNQPQRRLTRLAEATELLRQLQEIRDLLAEFPPLLGEAGQPGYLVLALARQQMIVPTFRSLLDSQRDALARDWRAGKLLLEVHRQFLRKELSGWRKRSFLGKAARTVRSYITDQPGTLLLFLALLALNLALWRYAFR